MGESRWIVLIDKTPRGPLTETEVRTLLEQKIVRVNDLASKIEVSTDGKKAEWKFLWQYTEFDRRRERDEKNPPTPSALERREKENKEKLEATKKHLLPEELENINPEDLSYHSTGITPVGEKQSFEDTVYETPTAPSFGEIKQFNWKAFAAIPVMAICGVVAFKLTGGGKTFDQVNGGGGVPPRPNMQIPLNEPKSEMEVERGITTSDPLSNASPKVNRPPQRSVGREERAPERNSERPAAAQGRPAPDRDKGELSYEEYRRQQEEQIEGEKDADDAPRFEEPEEVVESEPIKKKDAKKRKAASEEEEEQPDPLVEDNGDEEPRD